jgi:hypothetical protein
MAIVAAPGAGLRVAPGPHAHVHGIDGMLVLACGERVSGEQPPQSLGVDPPPVQRGVKAAPTTAMRCFEAQMDGRRNSVRGEDGVGEFEEGVGPAVEAFVERVAEGVESVVGFHDAFIMPPDLRP